MILVNKLKINLETVAYFTQKENDILNFIRNELKDLTIFTHEFYPENIFYFNSNNEIILEKDSNILYVKLDGFWKVLRDVYKISMNDSQELLLFILNNEIGIKTDIIYGSDVNNPDVERLYKQKNNGDNQFINFIQNASEIS